MARFVEEAVTPQLERLNRQQNGGGFPITNCRR
jgi:hypothetical protein